MSSTEEKIIATVMLEVLGHPPDHLKKALKDLIEKMGKEKGIKVIDSKIKEPKQIEGSKKLYTTFADVDVEIDSLIELMRITFAYMPSHIDIISPENLKVENNYLNEIFNEITRRLHAYDEVARVLQNEKIILERKLKGVEEKDKKSSK